MDRPEAEESHVGRCGLVDGGVAAFEQGVEQGRSVERGDRLVLGGGGVQANNPEMAVEMAAERVRDALAVGAEIIVSGCAACKDNLRKGARAIPKQERGKIKIMDITEIVAKAIE